MRTGGILDEDGMMTEGGLDEEWRKVGFRLKDGRIRTGGLRKVGSELEEGWLRT